MVRQVEAGSGRRWGRSGRRGRGPVLLLGAALALALAGCAANPQTTLAPESEYANQIQDLFVFTCWAALVVFIGVEGALIFAIARYRQKPGDERPRLLMGNRNLELAWTAAPVLILAVIAVPTVRLVYQSGAEAPSQSLQVTAVGHQWWFEFQYPGQHIVSADEMHIIVGQPVNVALRSADVMHSFWVPKLAGKRDMIPNHTNYLWFTPQNTGTYYAECAEFCGISHANMSFRVVVDTPQQFAAWTQSLQQPVPAPATAQQKAGATAFEQDGCTLCHQIGNSTVAGFKDPQGRTVIGPDLSHVGSRSVLAGGSVRNTSDDLVRWLETPETIKPGNLMAEFIHNGQLSAQQAQDLTAYLESLK